MTDNPLRRIKEKRAEVSSAHEPAQRDPFDADGGGPVVSEKR
jgi:hypothetical protein